mgnify:CR=1 FL=1
MSFSAKYVFTFLLFALIPILVIALGAGLPQSKFPGKDISGKDSVQGIIPGYNEAGSNAIIAGSVLLAIFMILYPWYYRTMIESINYNLKNISGLY